MIDYIEAHAVITRLNAVFGLDWNFEILQWERIEESDEVLVWGKLTACHHVKHQFGSAEITREKASGTALSLGDDYKAAATDCLKKCATLLGVGLHLYQTTK
jgi:hypothetical protein